MIRKIEMLAALCALAAISMASTASAATYVRSGSSTGPTYSGNVSAAQSGTSTLTATDGSGSTVSCASGSFTGSVGASGGTSVSGSLQTLDLGPGCSSKTFPPIDHCHVLSTGAVKLTANTSGTGGTMTIASLTIGCYTANETLVCTFSRSSSFSGTITNTDMAATFTNIGLTSTDFGCPFTANFSGKFAPIQMNDGLRATLWLMST